LAVAAVEIVVVNEPAIFKLVEKVGVEIVGAVASTTLPVPVDVVTPVPPRATANVPVVIAPASIKLVPAVIVLLVSVSADARPTSVSGPAGRVRIPELDMVAIMGAVSVLLVSVSAVALPTKVSVDVGRVSVPVLDIVAITGAVSVLLVSMSTVALPTNVSVAAGIVIVLTPLTIVGIAGVVRAGDIDSTLLPDPVDRATPVPPRRTPRIPVVIAPVSIALVPAVIVLFVRV
jgi:hypothetical protein